MEQLLKTKEHSTSSGTLPLSQREKGIHGLLLASLCVTEVTGRKTKHGHRLSWGGAMPEMLANLVHVRTFLADGGALRTALESQSCTTLPFALHVVDSARQALQLGKRCSEPFAPTPENVVDLEVLGQRSAAKKNAHNWHHNVSTALSNRLILSDAHS